MFSVWSLGITPIVGILKDIFRSSDSNQAHLVHHVHVLWSVQRFEQFSWFADELGHCLDMINTPAFSAGSGPTLHIVVNATRQVGPNPFARRALSTARSSLAFVTGRSSVRSRLDEAAVLAGRESRLFVFACGPAAMVHETWDHAMHLRQSRHQVDFHRECFEL